VSYLLRHDLGTRAAGAELVLLGQGQLTAGYWFYCVWASARLPPNGLLDRLRSAITDANFVTLASATFAIYANPAGALYFALRAVALFCFSGDKHFVHQRKDFFRLFVDRALFKRAVLTTGWLGLDDFDPTPAEPR